MVGVVMVVVGRVERGRVNERKRKRGWWKLFDWKLLCRRRGEILRRALAFGDWGVGSLVVGPCALDP